MDANFCAYNHKSSGLSFDPLGNFCPMPAEQNRKKNSTGAAKAVVILKSRSLCVKFTACRLRALPAHRCFLNDLMIDCINAITHKFRDFAKNIVSLKKYTFALGP